MTKAIALAALVAITAGCASSGTPEVPLVYRHPGTGQTMNCTEQAKTFSDLPSSTMMKVMTLGLWSIGEEMTKRDHKAVCERTARQLGYECVSGCK